MVNLERIITVFGFLVFFGSVAEPVYAMHISEGILPVGWSVLWFLAAIPFVAMGLRRIRERAAKDPSFKPMIGLVGAAVFIISCMPIPVPIAGTCSHPCGTGMAAILVGPSVSVVLASIALLLQALFLAHGGLTTLGANIMSMGVAGSFAGYGIFVLSRKIGLPYLLAAFLAGVLSDWATYAATSFVLSAALHADVSLWKMFVAVAAAFVPTQLPLGILEGFLTAGAYGFIHSRRPQYLYLLKKGETA